jgi:predicted GNAT superfamily acetyltransferase
VLDLKQLDAADLCRLNNEHAVETSLLSETEMLGLIQTAFYARGFSGMEAFLIAFDDAAPYANANFEFFKLRWDRFVYIDRVITARHAQRKGLARRLYMDLFERALAAGHSLVGCEVNVVQPNPASDAFHASLGFEEAAVRRLESGKTVRYLERVLTRERKLEPKFGS